MCSQNKAVDPNTVSRFLPPVVHRRGTTDLFSGNYSPKKGLTLICVFFLCGCGSKLNRRGKPQVLVHFSTCQGSIVEYRLFDPFPIFVSAGHGRRPQGRCSKAQCSRHALIDCRIEFTIAPKPLAGESDSFGLGPICVCLFFKGTPQIMFFHFGAPLNHQNGVPSEKRHTHIGATSHEPGPIISC